MALFSIFSREVLAVCLPADSPGYYAVSIAVVYIVGIFMNYKLQSRLVFSACKIDGSLRRFIYFWVSGLIGGVCALLLSLALRYELGFDKMFEAWSPTLSFAIALFISSGLTFHMNRMWVFRAAL